MIVATLLLAVIGATPSEEIHFDTQIVPVLTKAGCNAGACHGAAAGRGGFRLSLLGGDATADYDAIVQAFEGRRINLARPSESLVLAKPTGQLEHGGDTALEFDGPGARKLLDWIAAGAARGEPRRLTHFEISPERHVVEWGETEIPLRATARFDDGLEQDVTACTVFTAADPAGVTIGGDEPRATVLLRGQHVVVARFLDRVVPLRLIYPLPGERVDYSREPRVNFIDNEILWTLSILKIPVAKPADDNTFLRRVYLDLTGKLPAAKEVLDYRADSSADKRERCIDRLLNSDAFVDYWTLRFARLLRLHSLPNEKECAHVYSNWLRQRIQAGTSMAEVARELLTATGDSHEVGPANFPRMVLDARGQAELVSQVFLGVRLQCANCHNHPLDQWTQDDYHGLAAVFARLERGREVGLAARGAVTNLRTGEPAVPRIPGLRYLNPAVDCRQEFADWLTESADRHLARSLVNRLWHAMFGRGLVEPTDDLRATNPATHPELLDRLAADFVEHDYNIRHTLRMIALSHTYAAENSSSLDTFQEPEDQLANPTQFFDRSSRRPLLPEVLADAIADVTGVADDYAEQPSGTRAVTLTDPLVPASSLDILGRCTRVMSCEENSGGGGLPTRLHLLNGELINRKIVSNDGLLHRMITAGKTNKEIITEFYLRAFSRQPIGLELDTWLKGLASASPTERAEWLEDFVWSVLNCREFVTNH